MTYFKDFLILCLMFQLWAKDSMVSGVVRAPLMMDYLAKCRNDT